MKMTIILSYATEHWFCWTIIIYHLRWALAAHVTSTCTFPCRLSCTSFSASSKFRFVASYSLLTTWCQVSRDRPLHLLSVMCHLITCLVRWSGSLLIMWPTHIHFCTTISSTMSLFSSLKYYVVSHYVGIKYSENATQAFQMKYFQPLLICLSKGPAITTVQQCRFYYAIRKAEKSL